MKMKQQDMIRFGLYLAVILVINLVSSTLFFRWDLTKNKMYTLSDASIQAVSTLAEPLTIRFFLSEDLPQPNHNLEQEIRDLMEEYSHKANQFFNYEILMIDAKGEKTDSHGTLLTELARQYGITPVSTQAVSDNQVSLVNVYMGMVMIQGDMSEKKVNLGVQDNRESRMNLEYEITGLIESMASKTNELLAMDENIQVKLVFSTDLYNLGEGFASYADEMDSIVEDLQGEFYHRLQFEHIDPSVEGVSGIEKYGLNTFTVDRDNPTSLYAALVIERGDEFAKLELISRTIMGDRLQEPEELKESVQMVADRLLGVRPTIGYLADHGALPLYINYYQQQQQQQQPETLQNFYQLLSSEYQVQQVSLNDLPEGLNTLVIAGVNTPFSEYELYQLDQFLMNGGSVALFLDPFVEDAPPQNYFGAQPSYYPIHSGLEKVLAHHGIELKESYLMDENSYLARQQMANGDFQEIQFYNAPQILSENISKDLPFMNNLKGLIMLNAAPLVVDEEGVGTLNIEKVIQSSDRAWEMSEDINLSAMAITPVAEDLMTQYPLALLASGDFQSYFQGKEIPEAPASEEQNEEGARLLSAEESKQEMLTHGSGGQLLVVGTSAILKDNMLDPMGQSPNSMFVLNAMDRLSGREDYAIMRSKGQNYNPVKESLSSGSKTFIKVFNIAILPVLVILLGVFMWLRWISRRKKIQALFDGEEK